MFGRSPGPPVIRGGTIAVMRWLVLVCALAACDGVFGINEVPTVQDAPPISRPDAPVGVCGVVGASCCTSGTACTDGSQCLTVGTASRCVELAGAFEQPSSNGCPSTPVCEADTPFVNTPCTCPSGFAPQQLTIDDGCGGDMNPANDTGTITSCAPATAPPNTDWGGWYLEADLVQCIPNMPADHCVTPNPVTHACSCPGTTQPVNLRVFLPGTGSTCANSFLGGTLSMCLDPSVAVASIRGVYESDPDGNCRVPITGYGCRCPAGSVESNLRTVTERALNTGTTVFFRSTITMCLAAP